MDEDLVVIRTDWERDPDGEVLHSCLSAHFAGERAHERVKLALRLWLVASALVWLGAVVRSFPPASWRVPLLVAWVLLAAASLGFRLEERYWLNRLRDRLEKLDPGETEPAR